MIWPPLVADKVYEGAPLFQTIPTTLAPLKVIVPVAALVLVNAAVCVEPGTEPRDQFEAVPHPPEAVLFQSFSVPVIL